MLSGGTCLVELPLPARRGPRDVYVAGWPGRGEGRGEGPSLSSTLPMRRGTFVARMSLKRSGSAPPGLRKRNQGYGSVGAVRRMTLTLT